LEEEHEPSVDILLDGEGDGTAGLQEKSSSSSSSSRRRRRRRRVAKEEEGVA